MANEKPLFVLMRELPQLSVRPQKLGSLLRNELLRSATVELRERFRDASTRLHQNRPRTRPNR